MRYLLSILLLISFNLQGAELQLPQLSSPVMDLGGFLSEAERTDLSEFAYEINAHNGPQITILTVTDMQGYPIEDFSIRVAEKWQLGTKEKDNGLLIVIAKTEKQMRIEVGNGIEGEITDYDTAKFTRDIFPEYFKRGEFHRGLRLFMEDVAVKFNIKPATTSNRYIRRTQTNLPRLNLGFIVIIIIVLSIIGMIFKHSIGLRSIASGLGIAGVGGLMGLPIVLILFMFILGIIVGLIGISNLLFALAAGGNRGGGGGFGGGGGGWSGGGGGFSGGGSSGSW